MFQQKWVNDIHPPSLFPEKFCIAKDVKNFHDDFAKKSSDGCDDSLTQKIEETPGICRTNEFLDAPHLVQKVMSFFLIPGISKRWCFSKVAAASCRRREFSKHDGIFPDVGDYWRLEVFVFILMAFHEFMV